MLSWGIGLGAAVAGCDASSFAPPRPPELSQARPLPIPTRGTSAPLPTPSTASSGVRPIELVVGRRSATDYQVLQNYARSQAGLDKVRIQISMADEANSAASQAELLRQAIARDPLAVVVEPSDPASPELAAAVEEARNRGILVVVVGRPLEGLSTAPQEASEASAAGSGSSSSSKTRGPLVQVVPEPFSIAARALTEAAVRNARNAKLEPAGGAVILIDTGCDPLVEDRAAALRQALEDQGISTIEELRFTGPSEPAREKLVALMAANPQYAIVLGTDIESFTIAYEAASDLGADRPYVVAGFSAEESGSNMVHAGEFAGLAVYSAERLIRKAINTASQQARNREVAEKVELKIPLYVSAPGATVPKMPTRNESARMRQLGTQS